MKYIDAEKLIDTLERQNTDKSIIEPLIRIIESLHQEQSEVDLEEEVKKYFEGYWPGMKTPEACNHQMVLTPPAVMRMIEHFYELGINTRN